MHKVWFSLSLQNVLPKFKDHLIKIKGAFLSLCYFYILTPELSRS